MRVEQSICTYLSDADNINSPIFIRSQDDRYNSYLLMIDSGASCSTICVNKLPDNVIVDKSQVFTIRGIAGSTKILGFVNLPMYLERQNKPIFHTFYVLPDSCKIGVDGILGNDFLAKYQTNISFRDYKLTLSLPNKNKIVSVPLINAAISTSYTLEPNCAKLIKIRCSHTTDVLTANTEIKPGLFLYSALCAPKNGFIYCLFGNTTSSVQRFTAADVPLSIATLHKVANRPSNTASSRSLSAADRVQALRSSLNLDHLTAADRNSIFSVCRSYADVFFLPGDTLTTSPLYQPKLTLKPGVSPVYSKQYRVPHFQKEEVNRQVEALVDQGLAEPSASPFNSPVLLVKKKEGSIDRWRMVLDFRAVNKILADDKWPLCNIVDILDRLGNAKYFSTFDLKNGFSQCLLDPESRPITAFSTDANHWQLKVLPQGLKVSPAHFSRLMSLAVAGMDGVFHYLDDLVLFSDTIANHIKLLEKLLCRLREAHLKLNPNKCNFLRDELEYLGHVINKDGLKPSPNKVKAVASFPIPQNADETLRFVSMCNYYRRFVKNFALIVKPLTALQKKDTPFVWSRECQVAFETLKHALITKPVLAYPDFDNNFILATDFSKTALGAVLMNSDGHPVAYASRGLKPAETRYPAIHGELLAIVWATKLFRPYLVGHRFTVRTDHRPLKYLWNFPTDSSRLTKYRLALQDYDFDVEYVCGKENAAADALSRAQPENVNSKSSKTLSSESLKDNWVCAITRSQTKNLGTTGGLAATAERSHNPKVEADHLDIVELLRPPVGIPELVFFTGRDKLDGQCKSHTELLGTQSNRIAYYCEKENEIGLNIEVIKGVRSPDADFELIVEFLRQICHTHSIDKIILLKESLRKSMAMEDRKIEDVPMNMNDIKIDNVPRKLQDRKIDDIQRKMKDRKIYKNENLSIYDGKFVLNCVKNLIKMVNDTSKKPGKNFKLQIVLIDNAIKIDDIKTQSVLLSEHHTSLCGGHVGINRMYKTMKQRYFWRNMYKDIVQFVNNCDVCKKCKHFPIPASPLLVTTTATKSFEKVYLDLYGPMPTTSLGNKYLLTVQCELTKYSEAIPIPDKCASTIAKSLVEEIFLRYGIPFAICSDRGTEFVNSTLKEVCKILKIRKLHSTAYHHASIGALEASHKPLGSFLRSYLASSQHEWDTLCKFFTFSYNSTIHSSLGYSPFELIFGHTPRLPSSLNIDLMDIQPVYDFDSYAKTLRFKIQTAQSNARKFLVNTKINRCTTLNESRSSRCFQPGDLVFLKKEGGTKLDNIFEGPFQVVKVDNATNNVTLKIKNKFTIVHKDRIKF